MALTITSYFILALLSILIVVFVGRSLIKSTIDAYDASVEEKLFVYGFTGLTIVVLVASLIKTGGQTIHIILVVFAFLIAIANKQSIALIPSLQFVPLKFAPCSYPPIPSISTIVMW